MSRARSFDWEAARVLRAKGLSYREIGERIGCSQSMARFICDTNAYLTTRLYNAEWQSRGRCPVCGGRSSRTGGSGDHRCRACFVEAQATTVRPTTLKCSTCQEWKPDLAFPYNRADQHRRGRHGQCTACQTASRTAYRERRKVPCLKCGKLRLPKSEKSASAKRRHVRDTGLCFTCYQASRKAA